LQKYYILSLSKSGNNIFAGTGYDGVYLSTNNGQNWAQTSYTENTVFSLASSGNYTCIGTDNNGGIYLTTNNGQNWTRTLDINTRYYALVSTGSTFYAGTYDNGLYKSTNYGYNWTQTSLNTAQIGCLAVSGSYIYAGKSGSGIYYSSDGGVNWLQTLSGINVRTLLANDSIVIAGTSMNGVLVSTNHGQTWKNKNDNLPISNIASLQFSNGYVIAGTNGRSVWKRPLSEIIGIQNISTEIPSKYSQSQNYPNPFNPTTNIKFSIVNSGEVKLVVYDIQGREVQTLVNESLKPGTYEAAFDGSQFTSGVYFYKLITDGFTETKKMILIK
jgi:hypothetical protein